MHSGRDSANTVLSECDSRIVAVVARVMRDKTSLIVHDQDNADSVAQRTQGAAPPRRRLLICLPLLLEGDIVGVLYADGKLSPQTPVPSRVLELMGEHVAVSLDNARMFERAANDLLTGLPNNSHFMFHLAKAVRDATPARPGGILLIDLDDFKRINAAAGAEMGDRALVDIALTLREVLRTDGLVARYGSDKFAILLRPEAETAIGLRLRDVAERARAAVGTKSYHGISMSACIGGVAFPAASKPKPQDLVAWADDALLRARKRGLAHVEIQPQV